MNAELKEAFSRVKPACDALMIRPLETHIIAFQTIVKDFKKEVLQELQQYILFPFITQLQSLNNTHRQLNNYVQTVDQLTVQACEVVLHTGLHVSSFCRALLWRSLSLGALLKLGVLSEPPSLISMWAMFRRNYELQRLLINGMTDVLKRVTITSYDMCFKTESVLLCLVFEKSKPGTIADVPEELKLSVVHCLTAIMLNVDAAARLKLLQNQTPLLAQAVFLVVHLAKLEKLRILRTTSIECLLAITMSHPQLTDANGYVTDPALEKAVVTMIASILPGALAGLQDVAICKDNPGHAVVVAALNATHRILCPTMNCKYLAKKDVITAEDFVELLSDRVGMDIDVSAQVHPKDIPKFTPQWYAMAGEKISVVFRSLMQLMTHDHFRVRKELAVLSNRILTECRHTMQLSLHPALNVLLALWYDDYEEVARYSRDAVLAYLSSAQPQELHHAVRSTRMSFFSALDALLRTLNNIDSNRKLSFLNIVRGYLHVLERYSGGLLADGGPEVALALLNAASLTTLPNLLARHAVRDVMSPPPTNSPWTQLRHLDTRECEQRFQDICRVLAGMETAELLLDTLLEMFQEERSCELVYVINLIGSAPNAKPNFAKRIITAYIQEDVWYCPLEVGEDEPALTEDDTLDVSVYNPRAWQKESVPGLYEGAVETRYTDIGYARPRAARPGGCSLRAARTNVLRACLLLEGLGLMARRLRGQYQPYLLKTLCLILERVGSQYEMLHLAGVKAISEVAQAFGHRDVSELIACNADYFTFQITKRLKKAWNIESALQLLSVVMEYSDANILECMYGIVNDVLVQSCDKYHQKDLYSYLQVFHTFVNCIRKWFQIELKLDANEKQAIEIDVLKDALEFAKNEEEAERLLNEEELEKESGKSAEEMYREDLKRKEQEDTDYDDAVPDAQPPPRHISVTITIVERCIHFVGAPRAADAALALTVLALALPVLAGRAELPPLVHRAWAPLARARAESAVRRRALDLLLALASLAGDFIRERAVKEVLPEMYVFLRKQQAESELKDSGSVYRLSAAFALQQAGLSALPRLARHLALSSEQLTVALTSVQGYLSRRQPRPLQELAVTFFREMLDYDYGATWQHLRRLCGNAEPLRPPAAPLVLQCVVGSPYVADGDYNSNIKLIFGENILS